MKHELTSESPVTEPSHQERKFKLYSNLSHVLVEDTITVMMPSKNDKSSTDRRLSPAYHAAPHNKALGAAQASTVTETQLPS